MVNLRFLLPEGRGPRAEGRGCDWLRATGHRGQRWGEGRRCGHELFAERQSEILKRGESSIRTLVSLFGLAVRR